MREVCATVGAGDATLRTLRNALTESSALHLRNLLSFLYDTRPGKGDAVAAHFVGSGWAANGGQSRTSSGWDTPGLAGFVERVAGDLPPNRSREPVVVSWLATDLGQATLCGPKPTDPGSVNEGERDPGCFIIPPHPAGTVV